MVSIPLRLIFQRDEQRRSVVSSEILHDIPHDFSERTEILFVKSRIVNGVEEYLRRARALPGHCKRNSSLS